MFYEAQHIVSSDYFKKEYGVNYTFPPHMHLCFELIVLLEGNMEVMVNGNSYNLKANDAILIFPNQLHSLSSTKSKHVLFIFSPTLIQAFATEKSKLLPVDNSLILDQSLIDRLENLDLNSSKFELKGAFYSVCSIFEKDAVYTSNTQSDSSLLLKIFGFVDHNYVGDCTLKNLAKKTGYDYTYLSKYFKNFTNLSFNNYVNIYRLNKACYLLCNSDHSILNCAIDSGFSSLRSFNRNFKAYFNLTPHEYKNIQSTK